MRFKTGDKVRLLGTKSKDGNWENMCLSLKKGNGYGNNKHIVKKGDIVKIMHEHDTYYEIDVNPPNHFVWNFTDADVEPLKPNKFEIYDQKLGGSK